MFLSISKPRARPDYETILRMLVPVAGALLAAVAISNDSARAAPSNVFVIADTEGYGIMDCLTDGKSCGRIVADAWCESHGLGPARSFGRASDVTGAIPVAAVNGTPTRVEPDAAVVACGD